MNAYRSSLDRTWLVCAGYIAFVVYGSLVPLEFNGLGWSEAVDRFLSIRMYNLGVESRADWISGFDAARFSDDAHVASMENFRNTTLRPVCCRRFSSRNCCSH